MSHFSFRLRILSLTLSGVTLASLALPGVAHAKETVTSIAGQKATKQILIRSMQSQIKRHESMSLNEILAETESQVVRTRNKLIQKKVSAETLAWFDANSDKTLTSVRTAGSPEVVVATERAQLQQLMSAGCFFMGTREFPENMKSHGLLGALVLLPLAIVGDILLLPFSFLLPCW